MRHWGSDRRVHDVLRRVRDLLDRVLLAWIAYVWGCELKASEDLRAEVFGKTQESSKSSRLQLDFQLARRTRSRTCTESSLSRGS